MRIFYFPLTLILSLKGRGDVKGILIDIIIPSTGEGEWIIY
jgi:hypothetical protein